MDQHLAKLLTKNIVWLFMTHSVDSISLIRLHDRIPFASNQPDILSSLVSAIRCLKQLGLP